MSGALVGRAALTIGGGIIGNAIVPGIGGSIGVAIGAFAGSQLFPPESLNTVNEQPRLDDLAVQTSTYGNAIPFLWGIARVAGNVIWSTDILPTKQVNTIRQGGGSLGGSAGPQRTDITFTYSVSLAIALCRGPITGIRKVYADKILIFDPENPSLDTTLDFTTHKGTATQLPDPDIEAVIGVGLTPAHRGIAYVVASDMQLEPFGNRVPNFTFEVVQGGTNSIPAVQASGVTSAKTIEFDPETRLLWVLANNLVQVVLPSSMVIQRDFAISDTSLGIDYTPGYVLVKSSAITGITIIDQPPQMHIGSDKVASLGGQVTRINTHDYGQSTYQPIEGSATYSPAFPMFHWGTVILEGPNYEAPALSIGAGPQLNSNIVRQAHPGHTGATAPFFFWTNNLGTGSQDHVSFERDLYVIGFTNKTISANEFGVVRWAAEPVGGNDGGSITFHEDVLAVFTATGRSTISRLNKLTGAIEFAKTYTSPSRSPLVVRYHQEVGDLWVYARDASFDAYLMRIDPADGEVLEELSLGFGIGTGTTHDMFLYPGSPYAFIVDSLGNFKRVPLFAIPTDGSVSVQTIVDEILDECGIDATLRDTLALGPLFVKGYVIGTPMTGRGGIEPLLKAQLVDAVESDDVLEFVLRGGASATTILEEDMGATQSKGSSNATLAITRGDETELPVEVSIAYTDQDADFNRGTQTDRRLITRAKSIRTIAVPVVMTATEARQLASVFLYNIWQERDFFQWSTTIKHIAVEPTDIVTVQLKDGLAFNIRVIRVQYSMPALLTMRGFRDDSALYTQLTPGVPSLIPKSVVRTAVPTILNLMDIPVLRDEDENAGFYIASSGPYPGWTFANLYQSLDEGATYSFKQLLTREAAYGFAVTILATTSQPYVWDDINTVDVEMITGSITSTTDAAVLNGANIALLGEEIIQFVTVTSLGDNQFRLSRLLRGRQGTDGEVGNHVAFDRFVILSETTTDRVALGTDQINIGRALKAISAEMTITQTYSRYIVPLAKGLWPYSPVHLAAVKAMNDLTITWIRRARIFHGWIDSIDVPLDEENEEYEVDILDAPGGNVVNTYSVTAPTFVYTAAQQITDFGSQQVIFNVVIYQLSGFVAINNNTRRGFPAVAQFSTVDQTIVLQVSFNGNPNDASFLNATGTIAANAAIQNTEVKFGSHAAEFSPVGPPYNGSQSSHINWPDISDYTFGTDAFTVECWVRFRDLTEAVQYFVTKYRSVANQREFIIRRNGSNFELVLYSDGSSATTFTGAFTWAIDTWYHVAATRDLANDVRLFVDGTQVGSTTSHPTTVFNGSAVLLVGILDSTNDGVFEGFLDDLRVTVGKAQYTTNFTPPGEHPPP